MGLKSTIYGPFFTVPPKISLKIQQEIQKLGFKNFWPKNDKKYARFRALKSILEFNDNIGYFDMFQGFKKATSYGGARKLRLTQPPVCRVLLCKITIDTLDSEDPIFYQKYA